MERGAADFRIGVIGSRHVASGCRHIESIEPVNRFRADLPREELPPRPIDLQHGRMILRKLLSRGLDEQHKVHGVAGPPYSPLAIDEAAQSFLDGLPPDIEAAQGIFLPVDDLEIRDRVAGFRDDDKRLAFKREFGTAFRVRLCRGEPAELIVIGRNLHTRKRGCGDDVADIHPHFPVSSRLRDDPDIRVHQIHARKPVGLHIICRGQRVIALVPVIFFPIVVIVIVI